MAHEPAELQRRDTSEVEQVIEPAARIGRRLMVKLCLAPAAMSVPLVDTNSCAFGPAGAATLARAASSERQSQG
jgi:hypothetical protein